MTEVSLVKCESYDEKEVRTALEAVLEPVGGLEWVTDGMTVVIKANLVAGMAPDKAVTTHPVLICELTKMLKDRGARVIIGDSPGGIYSHAYVSRVYAAAGLKAAEECGAELNQDFSQKDMDNPDGVVLKRLTYTAYLDKADAIIDFCKLKSHGMMGMSAAAKNMFGAIPGTIKPEYHFKYPEYEDFANMIVDIDELFKPRLSIVDAVTGMEGNGPTAGNPKKYGFVAVSKNAFTADLVCATLLGIKPMEVPQLKDAIERSLCPAEADNSLTNLTKEEFEALKCPDTVLPDSHSAGAVSWIARVQRMGGGRVIKLFRPKPVVKKSKCVGCGKCAEYCPVHTIEMKKKRPKIHRADCIHCFCCQELCPIGAINIKTNRILKI